MTTSPPSSTPSSANNRRFRLLALALLLVVLGNCRYGPARVDFDVTTRSIAFDGEESPLARATPARALNIVEGISSIEILRPTCPLATSTTVAGASDATAAYAEPTESASAPGAEPTSSASLIEFPDPLESYISVAPADGSEADAVVVQAIAMARGRNVTLSTANEPRSLPEVVIRGRALTLQVDVAGPARVEWTTGEFDLPEGCSAGVTVRGRQDTPLHARYAFDGNALPRLFERQIEVREVRFEPTREAADATLAVRELSPLLFGELRYPELDVAPVAVRRGDSVEWGRSGGSPRAVLHEIGLTSESGELVLAISGYTNATSTTLGPPGALRHAHPRLYQVLDARFRLVSLLLVALAVAQASEKARNWALGLKD